MKLLKEDLNLDFKTGDSVRKISGDYVYSGTIVCVFTKLSGVTRYVVEDSRGLLFIFNTNQLEYEV